MVKPALCKYPSHKLPVTVISTINAADVSIKLYTKLKIPGKENYWVLQSIMAEMLILIAP